jgi:hypothetical protein
MCAYLNDAARFMESMAIEKPLIGQSLESVIGWKRPHRPSGCYCEADARTHKWALVYEVIHFGLVQASNSNSFASAPVIG